MCTFTPETVEGFSESSFPIPEIFFVQKFAIRMEIGEILRKYGNVLFWSNFKKNFVRKLSLVHLIKKLFLAHLFEIQYLFICSKNCFLVKIFFYFPIFNFETSTLKPKLTTLKRKKIYDKVKLIVCLG